MKRLELIHITFYLSNNIEVAFHRAGMRKVIFFYPCEPRRLRRLFAAANRMGLQARMDFGGLWIWMQDTQH